jgi:hypothetical protein
VSANIGCSLQIRRHLTDSSDSAQQAMTVAHPIQLLDRSSRLCRSEASGLMPA